MYADELDLAAAHIEMEEANLIAAIRRKAAAIEPGHAGECDMCGEDRPRLVERAGDMVCTFCRDKFKLG